MVSSKPRLSTSSVPSVRTYDLSAPLDTKMCPTIEKASMLSGAASSIVSCERDTEKPKRVL